MNKLFSKIAVLSASLALAIGVGVVSSKVEEVYAAGTDTITASDLAATDTSYTDFSSLSKTSGAVYAGKTAKDASGNIQMRARNGGSGIYTTTSGGILSSVRVVVGSGSNDVNIYGSHNAFSGYDSTAIADATLIGTVNATGTVTPEDQYEHVLVTSGGGAIYISSLEFNWADATVKTLDSIYVVTPPKTNYKVGEQFDPAGLVVKAHYEEEGVDDVVVNNSKLTFTPLTIASDTTAVTISYTEGSITKTVSQSVLVVTVVDVTGVVNAPTTVAIGGTIDGSLVSLNVTYTDSSTGEVKADSVSVDTSVAATGVTATATFNGASGVKTATFTVDVIDVPASTDTLQEGTFFITTTYDNSSTYYLPAAECTSGNAPEARAFTDVSEIPSENAWTISAVTGGFEIRNNDGLYLNVINDNKGIRVSTTPDFWTQNTDKTLNDNNSGRYLGVYSAQDWRSYTSNHDNYKGSAEKIVFYGIEAHQDYTAEQFAQDLLDQTDAICANYDGVSSNKEALTVVWNDLQDSDKYPALPAEEKAKLASALRDEEGDVLARAMYRYDYLVGKYQLNNFITGRTPIEFLVTPSTHYASAPGYIVIIVIATTSVLAFGLVFILRKKKVK